MSLSVLTARCTVVFSIGWNSRRAALIRDLRRLQRLADARRLRNLREQNGLGGLRRARHRREDARALMLERDLLEVGRAGSASRTSTDR